jgi:hypothetical protein
MEGSVMHRVVVLVSVLALIVVACGGGEDGEGAAADTSAAPTTEPGEAIVIRTRMVIAATEGAEPIATGEVLEGSTLGGSPLCAGGTIRDSHASLDPAVAPLGLIDRMITCSDGTVRIVFTPEVGGSQGETQTGSWTIVSGTGTFEGLRGSGEMEIVPDPDDDSLGLETLTGTVTR